MMEGLQGLPGDVQEYIRGGIVAQFATMSGAGVPIDTPTLYFPSEGLTSIDVATGLAYPAKADRARRNPKVGLLIESGPDRPVISISGFATVTDTDLQANVDRYLAETAWSIPGGADWSVARNAIWYWTRIIIRIVPQTVRWWDNPTAMDGVPHVWQAPAGTTFLQSDPPPGGSVSAAPKWPQETWDQQARRMMDLGAPGHLTLADADGFPLPIQARAIEQTDTGFLLDIPAGAPWARHGTATFTFEGRATFVGGVIEEDDRLRFTVERALPALPLTTDPNELWAPTDHTKDNLMHRLKHEAARRGQPLPSLPTQLPAFTKGANARMAAVAAMGVPNLSATD